MSKRPRIFLNERTMASAGSGKTYALTNRFIALASVYAPHTICALTFSKMSAGEFLDKILQKLADASDSESVAKKLGAEISELSGNPPMSREDFESLLQRVVKELPRTSLCTIDAFQVRFAKAFATELGILGGIRIINPSERRRVEVETLRGVFERACSNDETFMGFDSTLQHITGSKNEKKLFAKALDFLEAGHIFYCKFPDEHIWGNTDLLPLAPPKNFEWNKALFDKKLEALKESYKENKKFSKHISPIFTFLKNSDVGAVSSSTTKTLDEFFCFLRDRGFENTANPSNNRASLESTSETKDDNEYYKLPIASEGYDDYSELIELCKELFWGCVLNSMKISKALQVLFSEFERAYSRNVRMMGKLRFSDIPLMLSDSASSYEKSLVEYRLDARYNHWLLDEFQDTSRSQWNVLSGLLDEVFQDESGKRTVFYVGDRKQSLYSWRGGEPKLFDEIFENNAGLIKEGEPLNTSWRSSEPIISAVNRIFSDESSFYRMDENAAQQWGKMWSNHTSHSSKGDNGCVAVFELSETQGISESIYNLICELEPWKKGLTCAVLVQRNELALEIVGELRKYNNRYFTVAAELESGIVSDNMIVPAVMKLLEFAFHPSSTASEAYVKMTPLGDFISNPNWRDEILEAVASGGFVRAVELIGEYITKKVFDDFSVVRLANLKTCAAEFDDMGVGSDFDYFAEFLSSYTVREHTAGSTIQVMTIHKSKGLDFDIVIMPQLENMRHSSARVKLVNMKGLSDEEFITVLPPKNICAMHDSFYAEYKKQKSESVFGKICSFYVASTRPKKALYYMIRPLSEKQLNTNNYSFAALVQEKFCVGQKCEMYGMQANLVYGSWDWIKKEKSKVQNISTINYLSLKAPLSSAIPIPIDTLRPSAIQKKSHFENSNSRKFGNIIHLLFSKLYTLADLKSVEFLELAKSSEEAQKAAKLIEKSLANPKIAEFFTDKKEDSIFVEYPFFSLKDKDTVSGIIDRLIIRENGESADVLDFKVSSLSGNSKALKQKYASQMFDYALAVREIFKVKKIRTYLVDILAGELIECD